MVVLTSDGGALLSTGATRLELWRTDLVRMLSHWGEIDAPVKPVNTKLGAGCALMSAAGSESAVGVLEACRNEKDLRLTVPAGQEEDEPDTKHIAPARGGRRRRGRVLAVAATNTAVYLPIPRRRSPSTTTPAPNSPTPRWTHRRCSIWPAPAVTRAGDLITLVDRQHRHGVRQQAGLPLHTLPATDRRPHRSRHHDGRQAASPGGRGLAVYTANDGARKGLSPNHLGEPGR